MCRVSVSVRSVELNSRADCTIFASALRPMSLLAAFFDDSTQGVITAAAARFAANSPFVPFSADRRFYIPLISGLHAYTSGEVAEAIESGSRLATAPLCGHFLRWEVSPHGRLRLICTIASNNGLAHVSSLLPRGKEWRSELHTEVGSLLAIDCSMWGEFIEAVAAAFPIGEASSFTCSHLELVPASPRISSDGKSSEQRRDVGQTQLSQGRESSGRQKLDSMVDRQHCQAAHRGRHGSGQQRSAQ
mmetsp:Transcript_5243/g.8707  ORF Transcript_5243/g.8707 Transcript_5243/m.8707 type:complete len:246 (+) Transcript_5243:297-1034(+)